MTDKPTYPRDFAWPPSSDEDYRQEAVVRAGNDLADLLARVRLIVLDADGVLTDGRMIYGAQGEAYKAFHSRDGLGLVLRLFISNRRQQGLPLLAVVGGRAAPIAVGRVEVLRQPAEQVQR